MKTYQGSCHCGRVRFEVVTALETAVECNCSICSKKGVLHHRVPAERFRIVAGQEDLALYQFGDRTARHWFCRHCGIHPFSNPRIDPDSYSINVRCLDDFDPEGEGIEIRKYDGKSRPI